MLLGNGSRSSQKNQRSKGKAEAQCHPSAHTLQPSHRGYIAEDGMPRELAAHVNGPPRRRGGAQAGRWSAEVIVGMRL